MDIILVIIITSVVIWKIIYTITHIIKFSKEKDIKHTIINIVLFIPYIVYFYFLWEAVTGKLERRAGGQSWIIFIFILLTSINLLYDFRGNSIDRKRD